MQQQIDDFIAYNGVKPLMPQVNSRLKLFLRGVNKPITSEELTEMCHNTSSLLAKTDIVLWNVLKFWVSLPVPQAGVEKFLEKYCIQLPADKRKFIDWAVRRLINNITMNQLIELAQNASSVLARELVKIWVILNRQVCPLQKQYCLTEVNY